MATRMQQRRGTASQWVSTNNNLGPILNPGEIGFESDTNKFKIGDGINHWVNLTYFTDAASITSALNSIIDGAPDALNTLNELAFALGDNPNFLTSLATQNYVIDAIANSATDFPPLAGTGIIWNSVDERFEVDTTVIATQTALDLKAPLASPTFTGTVAGVTKTMVGLENVDNTSDSAKPVSTATQTALDLKAPLASPALTGVPTAPTATAGTATTQVATTAFVGTEVSNLVASSPAALDTLNELATALGNDSNFATTVSTSIGLKAPLASPTFTGTVVLPSTTSIGNVSAIELGYVDGVTSNIQTQLNDKAATSGNATQAGTETLTNKTIDASTNTLTGVATLTGTQTLTNKTLTSAALTAPVVTGTASIAQIMENATVSAIAATGTVVYNLLTNGAVTYFTSNASGNWTLNLRGDASNTLDSIMSTGRSLTIAFLVTNGGTAYYQTALQIDGNEITPKWQNGSAPAAGNINSIDIYSITVIKTGSAAFTALASQTKFA